MIWGWPFSQENPASPTPGLKGQRYCPECAVGWMGTPEEPCWACGGAGRAAMLGLGPEKGGQREDRTIEVTSYMYDAQIAVARGEWQ